MLAVVYIEATDCRKTCWSSQRSRKDTVELKQMHATELTNLRLLEIGSGEH